MFYSFNQKIFYSLLAFERSCHERDFGGAQHSARGVLEKPAKNRAQQAQASLNDRAREYEGGHEPHTATAAGTFEHVDVESAPHALGPGVLPKTRKGSSSRDTLTALGAIWV